MSKIYILPHKIGLATFSMLLEMTQTVAGLLKKFCCNSSTLSLLLIRLELQELTTDYAIQLRFSRTEYESVTNPNICQIVAICGIRGLCGIGV